MSHVLANIAICFAFLTIGLNLAFIVKVRRYSMFPTATILFLVGKSLLNVYVIISLFQTMDTLSWRQPLALLNYLIVASSLIWIYKQTSPVPHIPEAIKEHPEVVNGHLWDGEERREDEHVEGSEEP